VLNIYELISCDLLWCSWKSPTLNQLLF